MDTYGTERLKTKNPKEAIICQIQKDFNLTRIFAKAHYEQMERYFKEHCSIQLSSGQISYEAVAEQEPAGKPLSECRKVAVKLALLADEDLKALKNNNLSMVRGLRIKRICAEAQRQGALLSYEDLANLLSTSPSTVKRDIAKLRENNEWIATRGSIKDIGKGLSHKSKVIELYLKDFQVTEIALRIRHSLEAIERYLEGFSRVVKFLCEGLSTQEIRLITGFSERLINEYIRIYLKYKDRKDSQRRLLSLLGEREVKKGGGR
jgi:DNA-binding Lrp family transcriptional regulator